MSKAKMIITTFIAVLAFSAIASASASASWMVNGSTLTGSEELATTAKVTKAGELTALGITIECNGSTLNGVSPKIEAPNMGSVVSLTFTGCKTTDEPTCTLGGQNAGGSIGTLPVLAVAALEGTGVAATFTPTTKVFATIQYNGTECGLKGKQVVSGKAKVKAPNGQKEETNQLIEANTEEGELSIGVNAATLKGSAELKLKSGLPWSYL